MLQSTCPPLICPPAGPSIRPRPSTCPEHPCVHQSIHPPSVCPTSRRPSAHLSIPSVHHPPACPSICRSINSATHPSARPPHPSARPPTSPSRRPSICPSMRPPAAPTHCTRPLRNLVQPCIRALPCPNGVSVVRSSVHPSIRLPQASAPPKHPSIRIRASIQTFVHPAPAQFPVVRPSIWAPVSHHRSACPSSPSICPPQASIHPSVRASTVRPSEHPSVHLPFACPPILWSIHQPLSI